MDEGDTPPESLPAAPVVLTLRVDDVERRLERAVTADAVEEYVLAVLYVAFSQVELVLTLETGRGDNGDFTSGVPWRLAVGRSGFDPDALRSVEAVDRIEEEDDLGRNDGDRLDKSLEKVLVRDIVLPLRRMERAELPLTDGGITIRLINVFCTDMVDATDLASESGSDCLVASSLILLSSFISLESRSFAKESSAKSLASSSSAAPSRPLVDGCMGDGVLEPDNREESEAGVNFESGRRSGLVTFLRLALEEAV